MGIILSIFNYRSRNKKVINYVKTNSFDGIKKMISPLSRHSVRRTKSFDDIILLTMNSNKNPYIVVRRIEPFTNTKYICNTPEKS